jgi:hypothetical protein
MSAPPANEFAIDPRRVVHETIDGEVILIQLERGYYYSLDGVGAEIWGQLVAGTTAAEIAASLGDAHGVSAEAAVYGLLEDLHAESLVTRAGTDNGAAPAAAAAGGLARPVLHKYTDMEDFLLVDPVHDVDETGWPNRRAAG